MSTIEEILAEADQSFRDKLTTIDKEGKRVWLYPKMPKGKWTNRRYLFNFFLLAFFFVGPYIKINEAPLIMINVIERRFSLFGLLFWPQDFHLFLLAMLTLVVFVVLFTVIFGRIFCGWLCPQTIFMEGLFRRIEYFIEGDWKKQMELNQTKLSFSKFVKKFSKHAAFILLSLIISNTFLMYIISFDAWKELVTIGPQAQLGGFVAMLIFSGVYYGVYARFREQVCTVVCPYGRLQGVLLDHNTIVVAYDYVRGEKRGHFKREENREAEGKGHCIDCKLCVQVCPTGIDIRNGTQLECINCTACIDACDDVMDKVHLPKGLIRYTSEANIRDGREFKWTKRMIAYSAVLLILVTVVFYTLITRPDVEATILRAQGSLVQERPNGEWSNMYSIKLVNKTQRAIVVSLKLTEGPGRLEMVQKQAITVPPASSAETLFFIITKPADLNGVKNDVVIGVFEDGELLEETKTTFIGRL